MINIAEFKKAQEYIASINKIDLKNLEIEGIEILPEVREELSHIGRCNRDIVNMLIYWDDEGYNPVKTIWKHKENQAR